MRCFVIVAVCICMLCISSNADEQEISAQVLDDEWVMYGDGVEKVDNNVLYLKEKKHSEGVVFVSPDIYDQRVVLSLEIMPISPLTVFNIIFAASDVELKDKLFMPRNYDGNLKFWKNRVNSYIFSFGNSAENKYPDLGKYPDKKVLISAENNVLKPGIFNKVEVGRRRDKFWLIINGEELFKFDDNHEHKDGKIAIRIHGLFGEQGKCLIRNISIRDRK